MSTLGQNVVCHRADARQGVNLMQFQPVFQIRQGCFIFIQANPPAWNGNKGVLHLTADVTYKPPIKRS